MEINIIEDSKNKIEFEVVGESHSFCQSLKEELNNDNHVKISTYFLSHPLVGKPHFIIETDTSTSPKKAIKDAIKRIKKNNEKLVKSAKKEIK
ncbi:MAG: DNA-directed RNA polymerase subunit L [Candidatus Woesearchaeota archaeon]